MPAENPTAKVPHLSLGPVTLMRLVRIDDPNEVTAALRADRLVVEPKWDGYLVQLIFGKEGARVFTRKGHEITGTSTPVVKALNALGVPPGTFLLGELVYFDEAGLQQVSVVTSIVGSDPVRASRQLASLPGKLSVVLYDVLWLSGIEMAPKAFKLRRQTLEQLLAGKTSDEIILSPMYKFADWKKALSDALAIGGEGVVIKNIDSAYAWGPLGEKEPKPAQTWWKWKPPEKALSDDFVAYALERTESGALLAHFGQYHNDRLFHVGSINNFSEEIEQKLIALRKKGLVVIEIGFQERTESGRLRHQHFVRIRHDKEPRDVELPLKYTATLQAADIAVESLTEWYPKHPDTVIVKNKNYPDGLDEKQIWTYFDSKKNELFKQLSGRRCLTYMNVDGPLLRRKIGDEEIVIKSMEDIDELNNGRTMSFHIIAERATDVAWIDLDPQEDFPFDDVKKIVPELVPVMQRVAPGTIVVKYSGGRGFHILSWMTKKVDVDELRDALKDALNDYIDSKDDDRLTTGIARDSDMMRLDVSTLHESGSIRAAWSLHVETGLVSTPISPENISDFEKEDAVMPDQPLVEPPDDEVTPSSKQPSESLDALLEKISNTLELSSETPVIMLDIDSTLVDIAERAVRSLADVGVESSTDSWESAIDNLDGAVRTKFFQSFLSDKYTSLDKAYEEMFSFVKRLADESGLPVVIATGRPDTMEHTDGMAAELRARGVEVIDVLNRPSSARFQKTAKLKVSSLKDKGYAPRYAIDDEPEILNAIKASWPEAILYRADRGVAKEYRTVEEPTECFSADAPVLDEATVAAMTGPYVKPFLLKRKNAKLKRTFPGMQECISCLSRLIKDKRS